MPSPGVPRKLSATQRTRITPILLGLAAALSASGAAATPAFDYHIGFWMNLHHFLYRQALQSKQGRVTTVPDAEAGEQETWDAAVDYYKSAVIGHDLLRDEGLRNIKDLLAASENLDSIQNSGLEPRLAGVLERARPVYAKHWWAEHRRDCEQWVDGVKPLIAAHGEVLVERLTGLYGAPWPDRPVRVDVVTYATFAGAYTTVEPTHIAIDGTDPANQGRTALEVLFHEASHGLVGPLQQAITAEARMQNRSLPKPDLWHAVLFYTTGAAVKRELGEGYVPCAYKNGLWARAWPMYREPLERIWQPYVDGKIDRKTAISRLIEAAGTRQ